MKTIRDFRAQEMQITPATIAGTLKKTLNDRASWNEDRWNNYVTQSEASSAVSGSHVVVGWNDFETLWYANSITNWAVSHDGGKTFAANLGLPVDSIVTETWGDPAVAVAPDGTFYIATLAQVTQAAVNYSGVVLYRSTDNGDTFNWVQGYYAVDTADFYDKELIAVDPVSGTVYVTWTWFNNASPLYTIFSWTRTAGGSSSTSIVAQNDTGLQGSIPAVDRSGNVYVAYESWDGGGVPSIKIKKSATSGASWDTERNVATLSGTLGEALHPEASAFCGRNALKGNIRVNEFPSLAIDTRASGAGAGNLYVAFNASNSFSSGGCPSWGCIDVFLTRSIDGGTTWSAPLKANARKAGDLSDKFMPWVAVNGKGKVGLLYYDKAKTPYVAGASNDNWFMSANVRRFSPSLTLIDSTKLGKEFPTVTNHDWTSACYMGDYNSITNNKSKNDDIFYAAWGDNRYGDPDIQFSKIVPVLP
ncbi:MAG: hypothetical protein FIA94_10065 [Nitrospirae bacterium]|nr:hypothetical protein [Nitrospirota bacterium]